MTPIPARPARRAVLVAALWLIFTGALVVFAVGCSDNKKPDAAGGPVKLKVAYLGLTCEAPIFMAQEKSFFQEEGLDVELVKTDWDGLREGLGTGQYDANHTLVMYLLKPIENGTNVKMTGGVHTGCLRVQVPAKSDYKSVKELKGKKIVVPQHMYSPPDLFW